MMLFLGALVVFTAFTVWLEVRERRANRDPMLRLFHRRLEDQARQRKAASHEP